MVFENDNPSGLQENHKEYKVAVSFAPVSQPTQPVAEKMKVKAYFNNTTFDPGMPDCSKVYPVTREVDKTVAVGRASLLELLKGPTSAEQAQGYVTNINSGVVINRLSVQNGVARVDFNQKLQDQVGGSCKVTAIRAQITETLKQWSSVKSVVISINGQVEDILQP